MLVKRVVNDIGTFVDSNSPIISADPLPILEANNIIQMTRAIESISQVASYSHQIFQNTFDNLTGSISRQMLLSTKLYDLQSRMSKLDITNENYKSIETERNENKTYYGPDSALFSKKETILTQVYDSCQKPPNLQILDEFRDDKLPCLKFYSYPQFFFDEWKKLMIKENEERLKLKKMKKKMKQEKRVNNKVKELQLKTYNANGEVIVKKISGDAKVEQEEHIHFEEVKQPVEELNIECKLDSMSIKDDLPVLTPKSEIELASPPPPPIQHNVINNIPPPPPMMSSPPPPPIPADSFPISPPITSFPASPPVASPPPAPIANMLKSVTLNKTAPIVREAPKDERSSLLSSIRGGTQLKAVNPALKKSVAKESNDVAAILMRRAALEASDSESDNDSDESDDDWE